MKINKIIEADQTEEQCSVPVPNNTVDVPRLTQFSPGAG